MDERNEIQNAPKSMQIEQERLIATLEALREIHGRPNWWPGESRFEIMAGAVLTQNTMWRNVELAIANLKRAECLSAEAIARLEPEALAELIRPAGYYNVKARRLQNLCRWLLEEGEQELTQRDTLSLRRELLRINGVGPETADDILLYALERPVFVIDAYTRRLFSRFGWIEGDEPYDTLRLAVEAALGPDITLLNELHALIVMHAKDPCRPRPHCNSCPLLEHLCPGVYETEILGLLCHPKSGG